ncbi:unnamed protein product [Moneuplotes crassus]|uniref:Uncharacterized protein n=1 Tax=Euplotes crassus TaxID=5936 RepID=A0AAD2D7S8_EUPCR|nr:unnamed protein product [Moneuplotes crassus]
MGFKGNTSNTVKEQASTPVKPTVRRRITKESTDCWSSFMACICCVFCCGNDGSSRRYGGGGGDCDGDGCGGDGGGC